MSTPINDKSIPLLYPEYFLPPASKWEQRTPITDKAVSYSKASDTMLNNERSQENFHPFAHSLSLQPQSYTPSIILSLLFLATVPVPLQIQGPDTLAASPTRAVPKSCAASKPEAAGGFFREKGSAQHQHKTLQQPLKQPSFEANRICVS